MHSASRDLLSLCALAALLPAARADSTINATASFAHAANAGWIDLRPGAETGVVVGERFLSGHAYAANFGWITLGDGSPENGYAYSNALAGDWGVNHDGAGTLSGWAYAANLGWINFDWAGQADPNRPHLDLATGDFHGYAYAANAGWILLGTGQLRTDTLSRTDTDEDGIGDDWEWRHWASLSSAAVGTDADGDGQSDAAEYVAGTDPRDAGDRFRIVRQEHDGGFTAVTVEFTTTPGRLYRLERTSDLGGAWEDCGLGTFAPDEGATTVRTFAHPGGARQFFRAIAVQPLAP